MTRRYGVRDLPDLLRTPVGRWRLRVDLSELAWPLLRRAASAYRRTATSKARIVAVVGSYGKTTTARAVAAALMLPENPRLAHNTLSAVAINLLRMRPGAVHGVLEVGIDDRNLMGPYAAMIRPDIAVVTCVGSEHHRSLGSLEITREEKCAMVRALPPSGVAVLNGDDPNVRWMAGHAAAKVITFGMEQGNDVRAADVALDWPRGTRFRLEFDGGSRDVRTRLLGRHFVYPILAAVAVGVVEGRSLDDTLPALENLPPTPGRLVAVPLRDGITLLRDENKSSLETIHRALDLFAEIPAARRILVLGDVSEPPGSQYPIYRAIGERVAQIVAAAVFVGGGFRRYRTGASRAGMPRAAMVNAGRSVRAAAEIVKAMLKPGDVVLVKGRDTQRLDRVSLALAGRSVRCDIDFCDIKAMRCDVCPMLERGWQGLRVLSQDPRLLNG